MRMLWLISCLTGLLLAVACSDADTLGDQPPREVTITGNPTYANGIAELIDLKCAYCHAVPKPAVAPADIVPDLDLTRYETTIVDGEVIRGVDAIGRWLADGILDKPLDIYVDFLVFPERIIEARQMPLDYGTQLTDAEKGALVAWSANGSPRDDSGGVDDGDATLGMGLYLANCAPCHGATGLGENAFIDGAIDPERWYGPPIRRATATTAKIKSMYLHKSVPLNGLALAPMPDADAAAIRAHLLGILP